MTTQRPRPDHSLIGARSLCVCHHASHENITAGACLAFVKPVAHALDGAANVSAELVKARGAEVVA